jgi:hypothetical protein
MAKNSQLANKPQNVKRDEVLKRMLKMQPQPQKTSMTEVSQQLKFTDRKVF